MTAARDTILPLLPKLTPSELAEIAGAIKGMQGLRGQSNIVTSGAPLVDGDFLLAGIVQFLVAENLIPESSHAAMNLQRRDAYKTYKGKRVDIDAYLNSLVTSLGTKGTRRQAQVAFLAASALADLLRAWKVFSVSAMLSQVDKIPEAIEMAYPGYVQSGMFQFILRNS